MFPPCWQVLNPTFMAAPTPSSFFENSAALVSPGGVFHGTTAVHLLTLVHALSQQQNLRQTQSGAATSEQMSKEARRTFRAQYSLSDPQYDSLCRLCHEGDVGDVFSAYRESLPTADAGERPDFVRKSFVYDKVVCCGYTTTMRYQDAMYYDVGSCYPVKHYSKLCRGACGSTYYLNKRTNSAVGMAGEKILWHTYYPWSSGQLPREMANKSGRVIVSCALLTSVALELSRKRCDLLGAGNEARVPRSAYKLLVLCADPRSHSVMVHPMGLIRTFPRPRNATSCMTK